MNKHNEDRSQSNTDENHISVMTRRKSRSNAEDILVEISAESNNLRTRRISMIESSKETRRRKLQFWTSVKSHREHIPNIFCRKRTLVLVIVTCLLVWMYIIFQIPLDGNHSYVNKIEYWWHSCNDAISFENLDSEARIHDRCLSFNISSGGIGNQRGTIRNAIVLAKNANRCLVIGNFRCGTRVDTLITFPEDVCVTYSPNDCKNVIHFSETCVFLSGDTMTHFSKEAKAKTPLIGSTGYLEGHVSRFLASYNLSDVPFACVHLRKPEPGYTGDMGRAIHEKSFLNEFLNELRNVNPSIPLMVLSSGYEVELVDAVMKQWKTIVRPTRKSALHKHGEYSQSETLESTIQMVACSKAQYFLGRLESTFSREIALLSNGKLFFY